MFGPDDFQPGDYRLELWCCVKNRWACYAGDPILTLTEEQLQTAKQGQAVFIFSGAIYDMAPGAPRGDQTAWSTVYRQRSPHYAATRKTGAYGEESSEEILWGV